MSRHPEELLGPHLEGELGPDQRRAVELHLASCARCSQTLRELRATVELLHLLPEPPAPERLGGAVMERIAAAEVRPRARFTSWIRGGGWAPLSSVGALGASVAVLTVALRSIDPSEVPGTRLGLATASGSARIEAQPPALPPTSLRSAARRSSAPQAPFHLRAHPGGGVGAGAAAPPVAADFLPPRPVLSGCRAIGTSAEPGGRGVLSLCLPWLTSMLMLAEFDPQGFVSEVSLLPSTERDAWVSELVRLAVHSGAVGRVAGGLRSSVDARALSLAERFERGAATASAK